MHTGMMHTHLLTVVLFMIIYFVKAYYLLTDRKDGLAKWTKWTKIPEMVISTLFLATGIYLATQASELGSWFYVKIGAVIASIPLAVIGVKKENKLAMTGSIVLLLYAFGVARTRSITFTNPEISGVETNPNSSRYNLQAHGQAVYNMHCVRCHGEDGKAGLQGAPDLTASVMDYQQRLTIITMGKTIMPSFQNTLKEEERNAVVAYLDKFHPMGH
jgi:uncharacterized membrane protein SirB2